MSIFSKLRNAKKAADKHKGAKAVVETKPVTPYKHVPTHAAIDALSGAPSSWQHSDRDSIRYQNEKRRSQMGMVRNYSGLSNATSINTAINRNSSYNSSETHLSRESQPRPETRRSHLGFQAFENWGEESESYRRSQRVSKHGKSPLGSTPKSLAESASNSSSSSSSQVLELPSSHTSRSYTGEPSMNFSRPNSRPLTGTRVNFSQPIEDSHASSTQHTPEPHVNFSSHTQEFHVDFGQPSAQSSEDSGSYFSRPISGEAHPNPFTRQTNQKRKLGEAPWERAKAPVAAERPVTPPAPAMKKGRLSFGFGKKAAQPIAAH